ncbi:MAG: hypothetical protein WC655_20255 [Candidatus Hydrogenedentales bacterium]|jgi:hypothetical protein
MKRSNPKLHSRLFSSVRPLLTERSGATLLELAIASGILATTLVLLLGGIMSISDAHSLTSDRTSASIALEEVIEQVHTLTYDELLSYVPPPPRSLGAMASITISCVDATGAALDTPINPTSLQQALPNPIEVRILARWSDDRGRPQVAQTTCLFKR